MSDELEEKLDLSAWEAPEPPDDLADHVLARMAGTGVVPSVPDAPRRRAGLIVGVAAACLAAAAGVFLIARGTERAKPAMGEVVAESAKTLTLDGVRAELDPGTKVSWVRKDGVLHVQQPKGAAAWRVDGEEKLRIDAGATVASVEASGASLRVEVKMNQADARVIGGAAVTSMFVSMVTVVVYEGHVKVSGSPGQPTVIVQPGSTYTVTPPLVKEPPLVGASVPVVVDEDRPMLGDLRIVQGESATIHAATFPITAEFDVPPGCSLTVDGAKQVDVIADLEPGVVAYNVACATGDPTWGTLTLVVDDAKAPLAERQTDPVKLRADGRTYRVTFRDIMPPVEVAGSGTLHVEDNGTERTFTPSIIPAGLLAAGQYSYWFDPALKSTLVIDIDHASPMLRLADVSFAENRTTISGETLAQSTVSVRGMTVPIMADGRFAMEVDAGDAFALRVAHPHRGNHYYVLRSPQAVATSSGGLTRSQIMKVMSAAKSSADACGRRSKANRSGQAKIVVKVEVANGVVTAVKPASVAEAEVEACVIDIVRALRFPVVKKSSSFSFPFQIDLKPACDVRAFEEKAWEYRLENKHAAALLQIEAALKCLPNDGSLVLQAYKAACLAHAGTKATQYFSRLSIAEQTKFASVCTDEGIAVTGVSTTCDAEAAKDKGMEHLNKGQHEAALGQFEASLRCKDDMYMRQLVFMEACASGNSPKAKLYYKKLTPAQQAKFAQICIRQKPPVPYESDGSEEDEQAPNKAWGGPDDGTKGYLRLFSQPVAKVLIDGIDTGLTTPVTGKELMLTAGKHKVTFVIDQDRFTYPVTIKVGATETMTKDLQ